MCFGGSMEITLNDGEQLAAHTIARLRYAVSRARQTPDEKIGPQSNDQTDLEGAAAEFVVCKALGTWPELSITPDKGYDTKYNGLTIDVKSTTVESGRLLVRPEKQDSPADWYVLVTGTFPGPYMIRGFMHKNDLFKPDYLTDLGHGPTYAVPQSHLIGFEDWTAEAA